jgi:hypothetical protein
MNKDKDTIIITDFSAIDFVSSEEEPTNTTGLFDLEVDPLPDVFLKILKEAEKENE